MRKLQASETSRGKAQATGPMTFELYEQGRWAWFDAGKTHEIRNVGTTPIEFIEVEVRGPVGSPVASR